MLKRIVACGTNWRRVLFEARGKKAIIGYGHIGTQLGILAESLGMYVYFYDIETNCRWAAPLRYSIFLTC